MFSTSLYPLIVRDVVYSKYAILIPLSGSSLPLEAIGILSISIGLPRFTMRMEETNIRTNGVGETEGESQAREVSAKEANHRQFSRKYLVWFH